MTTSTIGTGGTYSTIAAWRAACPSNLVTATDTWIGQLKAETFTVTAAVDFSGITSNSTYYVELTTEAGASFADNANVQTNALRYNTANGAAITCGTNYVTPIVGGGTHLRLTKLQIENTNSNSGCVTGGGNLRADRCIFEAQTPGAVVTENSGDIVSNSLIVNRRASSTGPAVQLGGGGELYNCTLVATVSAGAVALAGNYGSPTVRNCAVFGFTAIKSGGNSPTYTTCATDVASPPTGFTGSLTFSSQFENVTDSTRDFRVKSGAGLINAGTTDTTYAATDIAGTARPSGASYDIGAWEFSSPSGFTLACDQGSYTLTGQTSSTIAARKMAAGQGSYLVTGSDADLLDDRSLAAGQGTYIITGSEAHADYAITCALGSYVVTGQAATVRASRSAAAAHGSYALSGQPAQIGPTRLMQAAGGSYALSGQDAATRAARRTAAGQGSYAVAGQDAGLVYAPGGDHVMTADVGAYVLSGQSAAARAARRVVAEQGLYALAGQAAALKLGRLATAQAGSYTLTGQDLAFEVPARLAADAGSYALTGQAAALTYSAIPAPVVLSAPPAGRRLQGYGRPANIQRSTR